MGWYEHTVAVALSRDGPSAFRYPERGPAATGIGGGGNDNIISRTSSSSRSNSSSNSRSNNSSNIRSRSSSRVPAPYRCPLCKVPGPYFLAVKPSPPAPFTTSRASDASKSKGINKNEGKDKGKGKGEDSPRLMFRLLGVRTVLGGGGPTSGGVEVENASDGDGGGGDEGGTGARGDGYPTMVELRAAVRTQLAVAAAVSALDEIKCRSGRRADSRGDSGATAVTTTGESKRCNDEDTIAAAAAGAAATAQTQTFARNQASPVSGGGKHSKGGSGRRHKHRTHRERQGAAASSTPNEVDWHRVSAAAEATAAGEGAGSDGSGEERHSCSRGNNAGRLRQAQLERGSDSPLGKRHREKKRKKRRRDAEEMDRVSSSRCRGERSRRQRNGKEKENRQGMSNHEQENGQRMSIYDHARGFRSSGRVSGSGCLHWEPGSMAAEDALADIEATLEREKEGLRGRTSEPTFSL